MNDNLRFEARIQALLSAFDAECANREPTRAAVLGTLAANEILWYGKRAVPLILKLRNAKDDPYLDMLLLRLTGLSERPPSWHAWAVGEGILKLSPEERFAFLRSLPPNARQLLMRAESEVRRGLASLGKAVPV